MIELKPYLARLIKERTSKATTLPMLTLLSKIAPNLYDKAYSDLSLLTVDGKEESLVITLHCSEVRLTIVRTRDVDSLLNESKNTIVVLLSTNFTKPYRRNIYVETFNESSNNEIVNLAKLIIRDSYKDKESLNINMSKDDKDNFYNFYLESYSDIEINKALTFTQYEVDDDLDKLIDDFVEELEIK